MDKSLLLKAYIQGYPDVIGGSKSKDLMNEKIKKILEASNALTSDEFIIKLELEFPEAKIMHDALILDRLSAIEKMLAFFTIITIIGIVISIVYLMIAFIN